MSEINSDEVLKRLRYLYSSWSSAENGPWIGGLCYLGGTTFVFAFLYLLIDHDAGKALEVSVVVALYMIGLAGACCLFMAIGRWNKFRALREEVRNLLNAGNKIHVSNENLGISFHRSQAPGRKQITITDFESMSRFSAFLDSARTPCVQFTERPEAKTAGIHAIPVVALGVAPAFPPTPVPKPAPPTTAIRVSEKSQWDGNAVFGAVIILALGVIAIWAAFPDSPSWSWEIAKISILLFAIGSLAIGSQMLKEIRDVAIVPVWTALLLSGASIGMVSIHFLFGRVGFPKIAWQFADVYAPISAVVLFLYSRHKRIR